MSDPVNHPSHYTKHPSGVECITIVEHMNFNRGNAVKYMWRAGEKGNELQDLEKARWYLDREITRLGGKPVVLPVADSIENRERAVQDLVSALYLCRQHSLSGVSTTELLHTATVTLQDLREQIGALKRNTPDAAVRVLTALQAAGWIHTSSGTALDDSYTEVVAIIHNVLQSRGGPSGN